MEWESNKRARKDDGVEIESSSECNNNAKKRNLCSINFAKEKEREGNYCFKACGSHLMTLEVFDFPWLKDGVMYKSDQWLDFEDNFSSFLEHQDTLFKQSVDFSEEYGLCVTPEASMAQVEEAKLVEDMCQPSESNGLELEAEDGDYIWSSPLNKPL